jgi:ribosomally synthesized peptide (two-chain TOMM family)
MNKFFNINPADTKEHVEITSHRSKGEAEAASTSEKRPPLMRFGQEDAFASLKALKGWQACWLRAIGLVWKNPKLADDLVGNPHQFFKEHCSYDVPPTLRIVVERDTGSTWSYDDKNQLRWKIRPTQLTVFLPSPPSDPKDYAIAMADFESIGTAMPFSFGCC